MAGVMTIGASTNAMAGHQWDNFHWQIPSGSASVDLTIYDCQSLLPANELGASNSDWEGVIQDNGNPPPLTLTTDSTGANCPGAWIGDPIATFPHAGQSVTDPNTWKTMYGFNDNYGNNGWLGLAIIEMAAGDPHILYGETFLNDFYVTLSNFNETREHRHVHCQEAGHVFGLDHVKDLSTCMYSSQRPFVNPSEFPNNHDGEQVVAITHSEDHTGGGGDGGGGSNGGNGGPDCARKPDHPKCQAGAASAKAIWAENFSSEDEMFESADLIVSATVLNGSAFDRVVGSPGRQLPVSQAILQVEETFKGQSTPIIRLEQTRGPGVEIEDDPGYVAGDTYILYLRQIDRGVYRTVNPQGRILQ